MSMNEYLNACQAVKSPNPRPHGWKNRQPHGTAYHLPVRPPVGFSRVTVRVREVSGSNPLAPTGLELL